LRSRTRFGLAVVAATAAALLAPSLASAADPNCIPTGATTEECTYRVPISVGPYEVLQTTDFAPRPSDAGFITNMETDIVDGNGTPVPISRLMLHHIVFVNLARRDRTCGQISLFDGLSTIQGFERFYAAGEERAKLALPPGYGYRTNNTPWALLYMVMNHRNAIDQAYVQYRVTIETNPAAHGGMKEVHPYWMDVENCQADPQYTVPGTGGPGSTHIRTADVVMPESGRIVAGAGHVHGGAQKLTVTEPNCGGRQISESVPTWGNADHPFYNVRPILHEPGPVNMTAFTTPTGIPVTTGETLRLNAIYDNSVPHMRVMGIDLIYVAPDASVTSACGPLPGDTSILASNTPGRSGPVPFTVPLTGLNASGEAVTINAPPGKLKKLKKNKKPIEVGDRFFEKANIQIRKGKSLTWKFEGELHNLTLANGPEGIASPNLNLKRTYSARFNRAGTYRFFCSLHPVQMQERVVVKKKGKRKAKKGKGKKKGKRKRK
jgi:plastocyanin